VEAGAEITRAVAVGGGTRARLWTQIVSDVCGLGQQLPRQTIGASYGDALMAAIGSGLTPPDTDWTEIGEAIRPDADHREVYDELFELYRELYPATRAISHRLAALQVRAASG
jgi:xylulokinase